MEVRLNTMVTDVDYMGLTVKEKDGTEHRIDCAVKVWSAGVQASPLGKHARRTVRRDRMSIAPAAWSSSRTSPSRVIRMSSSSET